MSAAGKRRGTERERQVRDWYTSRDWLAFRAPASLGCADVVAMQRYGAIRATAVELVEVKSTAGGPYEHFGPAARKRLLDAAEFVGARAVLAWWPPRGKLRFLDSSEWPGEKREAA